MRARFKSVLRNVVLSVASLMLLALLAEAALVVVTKTVSVRFTKVDPEVGYYHYPHASDDVEMEGHSYRITYNSHGYRAPEHTFEKPDGVLRVVVLGDSFTDGSEVGDNEVWTAILDEEFSCVEVINLGVYGYSTVQELITLNRIGLRYDPDLVLVVTTTNDYSENFDNSVGAFGPRPSLAMDVDSLLILSSRHPLAQEEFRRTNLPMPGARFFHQYSHLYYVFNHFIYQPLMLDRFRANAEVQQLNLSVELQREAYVRLVSRIAQRTRTEGADFLVAFAYKLSDGLVEKDTPPGTEVAAGLAIVGVESVDLYQGLRQAELGSEASLYYAEDIHWNTSGHEAVAGLLKPHIERWMAELPGAACEVDSTASN